MKLIPNHFWTPFPETESSANKQNSFPLLLVTHPEQSWEPPKEAVELAGNHFLSSVCMCSQWFVQNQTKVIDTTIDELDNIDNVITINNSWILPETSLRRILSLICEVNKSYREEVEINDRKSYFWGKWRGCCIFHYWFNS